jgi:hypothetical protein
MLSKSATVAVLSGAMVPVLLLSTRGPTAERANPPEAVSVFEDRVADYVGLRHECVRRLRRNGLERVSNVATVFEEPLGDAIRHARRGARPGDVLSPVLTTRILQLVRTDLASRTTLESQAVLEEVPALPARVNDLYPPGAPLATMPPLLLTQLPPLPPELQYRFLGRALILLDADANLIVDVVPDALPERP